jgi:hypothetical protein
MFHLSLPYDAAPPLYILCLGAHSDDIEIGCGGTILHLARQYPKSVFHWVVFSALRVRAAEAKGAAELLAALILCMRQGDFFGFLHLVLAGGAQSCAMMTHEIEID